ncbi:MAG: hypothetical protein ABH842_02020 [Candidatus Micrarchaeota archaeon]
MAKPVFDIKKMFLASILIIVIGVVLTILSTIVQVLPVVLPEEYLDTFGLVSMVYLILLYPIFFGLYLWGGIRSAKNYGFDLIGAGTVAAFSYFIIAMIKIIINAILALIVISRPVGNFGFGSMETAIASILFDTTGTSGIGISALCGVGLALIGTMVNFVVGGIGGWIVLRKKF